MYFVGLGLFSCLAKVSAHRYLQIMAKTWDGKNTWKTLAVSSPMTWKRMGHATDVGN